jgi:hypothetical protein
MLKSDNMRNLLGGPLYDAASPVKGGTVRAWVANNGLRLGDREERDAGKPRYDVADVARLLLMHWLTSRQTMSAKVAADMTNAAWQHIAVLSDIELAAMDVGGAPEMPRYIMSYDRVDGMHRPTIAHYSQSNHPRGPIMETRIELRELVRMARDRLCMVVGVDFKGLHHRRRFLVGGGLNNEPPGRLQSKRRDPRLQRCVGGGREGGGLDPARRNDGDCPGCRRPTADRQR